MANSDYKETGIGSFATYVKTDVAREQLDTVIDYTDFVFSVTDAIQPGMYAMWEDEICEVQTVGIRTFTLKRGCADTLPARHAPGTIIWIINNGTIGTDRVERSAGETIAVKISPFTVGGGNLPIGNAPPEDLTFNWRYFRPYNAAYVFANAARWYSGALLNDTTGGMNLTWRDRNRVMQADQLLGQDDATMTPEAGTTYTLRIYDAGGALLRTEPGIIGNAFLYQFAKARYDFGNPGTSVTGTATFHSERDRIDSLQGYSIPLTIASSALPIPSEWLAFDQVGMAAPYVMQMRRGLPPSTLTRDYGMVFAVRPADRMSDNYNLYNGSTLIGSKAYAPWVQSDFRLPELETTLNVRTSSLYDGVRVDADVVGKIGLIDDELVVVKSLNADGTLTLGRGVGDTIPAVHIAGSKLYLFDTHEVIDATLRNGNQDYRVQPGVFGTLPNPSSLPSLSVGLGARGYMPYNVAQLQINGRPWFEEVQAINGAATQFLWAWRNRVTQGADAVDHAYPSIDPESGCTARLTFYYETAPTSEGGNPIQHTLRTVSVDPVSGQDGAFAYTYAMALADGNTAGTALGVCGTVQIYCRIDCVRENYISYQRYTTPIRVPSYPCT